MLMPVKEVVLRCSQIVLSAMLFAIIAVFFGQAPTLNAQATCNEEGHEANGFIGDLPAGEYGVFVKNNVSDTISEARLQISEFDQSGIPTGCVELGRVQFEENWQRAKAFPKVKSGFEKDLEKNQMSKPKS